MFGLALLLSVRGYAGINHDARLYLGQALLQQWPDIFSADLFFVHGSQERFSIFPALIGALLHFVDAPTVFMIGAGVCLILFNFVGWMLLRELLPAHQRCWAWLAVLCLPVRYGGREVFAYGEQFFTPRTVAEFMGMFSLWLVVRGRTAWGLLVLASAALFHPLQALAVAFVLWFWLLLLDRRWLHALWAGLPVLMLGAWGVEPFSGLFHRLDPEWAAVLHAHSPHIFLADWRSADYQVLGFDVIVLIYSACVLRTPFGRWCLAALLGLVAGIGASYLLVDVFNLVLPAGLQLWRVHWLAHWFAMAALGALLCRDVQNGDAVRAMLLAVLAISVFAGALWIWMCLVCLYVGWPGIAGYVSRPMYRSLGILLAGALVVFLISFVVNEWANFSLAHYRFDLYALDRRLLGYPLVGMVLGLGASWLWPRLPSRSQVLVLLFVLFPLAALSILRWDSRPFLNRAFEEVRSERSVFGVDVPRHAQVFWDGGHLLGPWLILGRASYFSPGQLAGSVFNRATAVDSARRLKKTRAVTEETLWCQIQASSFDDGGKCEVSESTLKQACALDHVVTPDFLVLSTGNSLPALGQWQVRDPVSGDVAITFYLHSCADIRRH